MDTAADFECIMSELGVVEKDLDPDETRMTAIKSLRKLPIGKCLKKVEDVSLPERY